MPQDPKNQNNNEGGPRRQQSMWMLLIGLLGTMLILNLFNRASSSVSKEEKISYDKFIALVEEEKVEKVELREGELTIFGKKDEDGRAASYKTTLVGEEDGLNELLAGRGIEYTKLKQSILIQIVSAIVSIALPLVLVLFGMSFIFKQMGRGGMMGVGKSKAKAYVQQETGITFADVAGENEAKESLQEVVEFLHNPEKYAAIGAKLPRGALLVGPPGTGKTLLAKAVAGEAHVPFFSLSGSEFVEMFVGVGASRVRDLFDEAKKNAPCIIFIDEIDAIGRTRDTRFSSNDEREQTLNQLLAEMDGFDTTKGLLILAATNRPEVLDPALLRPGRFDRRIIVDRPDLKGRVDILKVHAKKVILDETVDFDAVALATSGAVGSDLANMINEAAILAVKNGRRAVSQADLLEAVEIVLVGKEKKDRVLSKEERKIVAYHEVGHALVSALQKDAEPVQKITIVPRTMGALGYTLQVPEEEKYLNSRNELNAMIVTYLGGRAAEDIVFGDVTTGAANDIERATQLVRAMVTQYGMSEKFGLMGLAQQENQYLDGRTYLNCGDATATEIDHEVMKILHEAYEQAKQMLSDNRDALDRIANYLLVQETITGKEFLQIFHRVKEERENPDLVKKPAADAAAPAADTAENVTDTATDAAAAPAADEAENVTDTAANAAAAPTADEAAEEQMTPAEDDGV